MSRPLEGRPESDLDHLTSAEKHCVQRLKPHLSDKTGIKLLMAELFLLLLNPVNKTVHMPGQGAGPPECAERVKPAITHLEKVSLRRDAGRRCL